MQSDMLPDPIWVDTPDALQRLVEDLSRSRRLAVDTESNSLYAYRERVCLLQFSTAQADYLVDPLALDDIQSLEMIFADEGIEKIFHAAEQDLIGLKRDFGFRAVNLFDTMQSARILGYAHVGLDALLNQKFGLTLNKRFQKADWGRRPLPPEQRMYARLDTRYLPALRDLLEEELRSRGLLILAREDFALLSDVQEMQNGRTAFWQRAARQYRLSPRQWTVLSVLCRARDDLARQYNQPVFKIVADDLLVELACRTPHNQAELFAAGMTSRQVERFGTRFLQAIEEGRILPVVQIPATAPSDPAFVNRWRALSVWRKKVARQMGVESDIVLPRRYLQTLAENPPKSLEALAIVMRLSPWRFEHFGREILSVLAR